MDGVDPAGGTWNLDAENRQPPPRGVSTLDVPEPWWPEEDEIDASVRADLDRWAAAGEMEFVGDDGPRWAPATRSEAVSALRHFVRHRLPAFGPYEDAMLARDPWMAHSALSPAMNLGLLHPIEIVRAAERLLRGLPVRPEEAARAGRLPVHGRLLGLPGPQRRALRRQPPDGTAAGRAAPAVRRGRGGGAGGGARHQRALSIYRGSRPAHSPVMGEVLPMPRLGGVVRDVRGAGRALRVSWHGDHDGIVVLSLWDGARCTGTVRVAAHDVPTLVEALQIGLRPPLLEPGAELVAPVEPPPPRPSGLDILTGPGNEGQATG
jgi:deoxyribodipyrimidine photo-lyase-related protein